VGAAEAERVGLVEQVSEDDRLLDDALDLAEEIAAMPPAAIAASKRCVNTGMRDGFAAGMAAEAEVLVPVGLSDDAIEGQRAFMEKRPPRFGN
jgi:enoyl-CoA hydratase/carnithine racemase